jgi:hypothetical protein
VCPNLPSGWQSSKFLSRALLMIFYRLYNRMREEKGEEYSSFRDV